MHSHARPCAGSRASASGAEVPFTLTRWADGRLSLDDPTTTRHIDLEVFGPTNTAVFSNLMMATTPSR